MYRHRIIAACLSAAALLLVLDVSARADGVSREYQLKAAFVFNFSQFIEWPEEAFASKDSPFVVTIVGQDPFAGAIEQAMAGKSVGTHPVVIKHVDAIAKFDRCQILFVPATEDQSIVNVLRRVIANSPVLTVGESDAFIQSGGAIRFYTEDNKIRFEVNQEAAASARLKISSKLLRLARIYKKQG